jgi:hypothetical protein
LWGDGPRNYREGVRDDDATEENDQEVSGDEASAGYEPRNTRRDSKKEIWPESFLKELYLD